MLSVLLASFALALEIPLQEGDQLLLKAPRGQVAYTSVAGMKTLKIPDGEMAGWSWERNGHVVSISGPELNSRSAVAEEIHGGGPRPNLEITGPSMPIECHLREGSVNLVKGQHEAKIILQSGKVLVSQKTGGLKLSARKADILVQDSAGRLDLDLFQGTINLRNHSGDSAIHLFSGQFNSDQEKGNLSLTSHGGVLKLQKFSGTLQLDLTKATIQATGVQGRIEGQTGESAVQLRLQPETDVNLKSLSGKTQIQLPASSGAGVNLATGSSGDLFVPNELKVFRGAAEKTARGRLHGDGNKVQVNIRSVEGTIVLK